ncbi:hypothetical protein [Tepidibacter sp. Z1-5]|uniref:hypothetical protein n=1 Tax=Tepidibacter sp. Z1-5 TaxID=3134138 RepID=UPI0030BA84B9
MWEKAVLKRYKDKLDSPTEAKQYFFKGLLKCSHCNKKIKLIEDRYVCNDGCTSISKNTLIKLIFSKILWDINTLTIQHSLSDELSKIETKLNSSKRELKSTDKAIKRKIHEYMNNNPNIDITNLKERIEKLTKSKEETEINIQSYGKINYNLSYCLNNIEKFKILMFKINDEDVDYFDDYFEELKDLLNEFIKKVVLNNNLDHVKVEYI